MSEIEYIVSTHRGINVEEIDAEMTSSSGSDTIPNRTVDIANARNVSTRSTHFMLTAEEAEALKNDPRIANVEPRTKFQPFHHVLQPGNFTKTTSDSGSYVNWGLRRCIAESNTYGTNITIDGAYSYNQDGTGVDIVIQDSGLQVDHPEFIKEDGTSRVKQIDWFAESGVTGTQSVNHYRDYHGHGTHVAGIAAGKTYGWAKNANVYSVKVAGLEGTGDSGTGLDAETEAFDVITGWHLNKPVDPRTGVRRPTIVNMSWGYGEYSYAVTNLFYRGTETFLAWGAAGRAVEYGLVGVYANVGLGYRHVVRVSAIDVNVQEMIDAGIHVCIAAGNSYQKCDVVGGSDYNNYYQGGYFTPGNVYYNRGGSPFDNEAMYVGNADSVLDVGGLERKAASSECGPAITVWAPGTNIMSCTSTTNVWGSGSQPYYANSNFKQTNISGTSMASPQVCGLGALHLQANPHLTPAQLKSRIIADSKSAQLYSTGLDNDYTINNSIKGAPNRFMFSRYGAPTIGSVNGPITLLNTQLKNNQ